VRNRRVSPRFPSFRRSDETPPHSGGLPIQHARIAALILILAIAGIGALLTSPAGRAQTPNIDILSISGDVTVDETTGDLSIPPTGEIQIEFAAPGVPNPDFAATNVNGTIIFEGDNGGDFVSVPAAELGATELGTAQTIVLDGTRHPHRRPGRSPLARGDPLRRPADR